MEQNGPVNLFRFITNPNDFAQSVENLFYLSFLIRDGECALEIEEDGEPVICTPHCLNLTLFFCTSDLLLSNPVICEQPQVSDYQEGLRKQQLVFEFDITTWEVSPRPSDLQQMIWCSACGVIRRRLKRSISQKLSSL